MDLCFILFNERNKLFVIIDVVGWLVGSLWSLIQCLCFSVCIFTLASVMTNNVYFVFTPCLCRDLHAPSQNLYYATVVFALAFSLLLI